jgi:hypothetical protein
MLSLFQWLTYLHPNIYLINLIIFYYVLLNPFLFIFISLNYSFIHMCVHCLGHFSPLSPSPQPLPSPNFQIGHVLPLSLILLKKRHKHNKEDKVFLLVKDSYTEIFLALLSYTHALQPMMIHH